MATAKQLDKLQGCKELTAWIADKMQSAYEPDRTMLERLRVTLAISAEIALAATRGDSGNVDTLAGEMYDYLNVAILRE